MVDKTETITVLPHPFDRDNNELTDQEARIAATVNNRDVWKLTTTVPWSSYPNNTLSMPRTSGELPPLGVLSRYPASIRSTSSESPVSLARSMKSS